MHTDAEIREHLERAGLAVLADRVLAGTRPEVWIAAAPVESQALGRSRIGGAPDLPRGMAWPRQRWPRAEAEAWPPIARQELAEAIVAGTVIFDDDQIAFALPFVAQLDLEELAPLQAVLPRRGHLWFFAEQTTALGEIAGYPYCASVCMFAGDADLVRLEPPPVPEAFDPVTLGFTAGRSLPHANDLGLDGDAWYLYQQTIAGLEQPAPRHACLPHPDSISPYPPEGYTALLRVDTDSTCGTHWGDAAWITFAIPDDALAGHRFDEVRGFRWIG